MPCPGLNEQARSPVLVLAVGNPSRGDDAIGPLLAERLEAAAPADVEVLTDFQLQIEHVLDLRDRRLVIFADAAVSGAEPFSFAPLGPAPRTGYITHALSPATLVLHYRRLFGVPPEAFVLAVRGYEFDLGTPLSAAAARNLEAALSHIVEYCAQTGVENVHAT